MVDVCSPNSLSAVCFEKKNSKFGNGSFLLQYPHLLMLEMLMKMLACKDGDESLKIEQMFSCCVVL